MKFKGSNTKPHSVYAPDLSFVVHHDLDCTGKTAALGGNRKQQPKKLSHATKRPDCVTPVTLGRVSALPMCHQALQRRLAPPRRRACVRLPQHANR